MIRLQGVRKRYRTGNVAREVLRGIDLEIRPGEVVSIVGRSGSGKTTLLNLIGGLDTDYDGSIEVGGKDLHRLSDRDLSAYRNQQLGFVFQSFHLLDHLTCAENASLPALFSRGDDRWSSEAIRKRAQEVLDEVGLGDRLDDPPRNLSGGEKQRVVIARALFNRPNLMICDEPTGNLDSATASSIFTLFRDLNRREGITLVVVTHDDAIADAAGRRITIRDGLLDAPASEPGGS